MKGTFFKVYLHVLVLFLGAISLVSCRSMPDNVRRVTCKPIIRTAGFEVNNMAWGGGSEAVPRRRGNANRQMDYGWPVLVLLSSEGAMLLHFVDRDLLKQLDQKKKYTFFILPPGRDERGVVLPEVYEVKDSSGKRIYRKP